MNDDRAKVKIAEPDEASYTEDFRDSLIKATEELAARIEWLNIHIPGGPRKRHRYRTAGHGIRRLSRRQKNKVARKARRADRRAKKRRRS